MSIYNYACRLTLSWSRDFGHVEVNIIMIMLTSTWPVTFHMEIEVSKQTLDYVNLFTKSETGILVEGITLQIDWRIQLSFSTLICWKLDV